jgi:hypothetical protein
MAETMEIGARVSLDLLAAIDKAAEHERRSRAEIITFACEKYTRKFALPTEAEISAVMDEAEKHLDEFLEGAEDRRTWEFRAGHAHESAIRAIAAHAARHLKEAEQDYYEGPTEQELEGYWLFCERHEELAVALRALNMRDILR